MKKRLGEITLEEMDAICRNQKNCSMCPFHIFTDMPCGEYSHLDMIIELNESDLVLKEEK